LQTCARQQQQQKKLKGLTSAKEELPAEEANNY
jgi:hypothetical protein